ncbi:hypothetical protein L6164_006260 [Bauhinia variegata]|uniref:Uncharacterized protein n=1 Tax=Bauhinia variegata TaxID=167791 RepID=A0ACB9PVZ0_BAUVA|nr:hypothetical protein L6164_006260 [Bauhinia variegata]
MMPIVFLAHICRYPCCSYCIGQVSLLLGDTIISIEYMHRHRLGRFDTPLLCFATNRDTTAGSKVKAGELSSSIWAAFVGYTFTLTFAGQGLVNTLGDLCGSLASVERINSVLSGVGIDEALAFGLEGELKQKRNVRKIVGFCWRKYCIDDDVSGDDVIKAAKAANAHNFIISLRWFFLTNQAEDKAWDFKAGELSFSIWAAFVGYTFTLTFAVQGLVNTLGDLRGSLASVERINSVLSGVGIDEALAFGLEGELKQKRNDDVSGDDVIKAAKAANAHNFIISLRRAMTRMLVGVD